MTCAHGCFFFWLKVCKANFFIQQMYLEHLLCARFGAAAMDSINTVVSSWDLGDRMWETDEELIT